MLGFLKKHKDEKNQELEEIKDSIDKGAISVNNGNAEAVPPLNEAVNASQVPSSEQKTVQQEISPASNVETTPVSQGEVVNKPSESQPSLNANSTEGASITPPAVNEQPKDIESLFNAPSGEALPSEDSPESSLQRMSDEDVVKEAEATVKIAPPLFISVQRYKEIVNELLNLKASLVSMESVVNELNKARDEEVTILKTSIDELDNINKKIKYFVEAFRVNG